MDMKETVIQGIKAALAAADRQEICRTANIPMSSWKCRRKKSSAILRPILPCNRLELLISHRV